MPKKIFFHVVTFFVVTLNSVIKPSLIYFLTSFLSVIMILIFHVSIDLDISTLDELSQSVFINLQDTSIISTILSTIACFLVGLYYLVDKPTKNTSFVATLWILVVITIFLFTITLVEMNIKGNIFNQNIKFYITYFLLFCSFSLTMYAKVDYKNLKKMYSSQFIAIESKFMNESEYNGHKLKL